MSAKYKGLTYRDDSFEKCIDCDFDLEEAILHPNTRIIEKEAFARTDIKFVSIPEGVTSIQASAFENCKNLEEVVLPKNLKKLYDGVFQECDNLKRVDFSETKLTSIPENTFWKCKSLETVILPKKLKTIHRDAFFSSGLKEISLPETLEAIGNYAFTETNLKEITLPKNVKIIEEHVFSSCKNLEKVEFGDIEKIGHSAFDGCEKLENINLPASLKELSLSAFDNTKIKELTLSENLETIWYPHRMKPGMIEKVFYTTLPKDTEKNLLLISPMCGLNVEKKDLDYIITENTSFKEINKKYKDKEPKER